MGVDPIRANEGGEEAKQKRFQSQKVEKSKEGKTAKAWNSAEKKVTDGRIDCHLHSCFEKTKKSVKT